MDKELNTFQINIEPFQTFSIIEEISTKDEEIELLLVSNEKP